MSTRDPEQPLTRDQLRDEIMAVLAARRELSLEDEKYLAEAFLEKLDREIDARIDARLAARAPHRGFSASLGGIVIALFIFAIPLSAIAGDVAGPLGLLFVWGTIALIVAFFAWSGPRGR